MVTIVTLLLLLLVTSCCSKNSCSQCPPEERSNPDRVLKLSGCAGLLNEGMFYIAIKCYLNMNRQHTKMKGIISVLCLQYMSEFCVNVSVL